jgi:tRNA U34 5-methylaminomethyl-2-thiouridine-forming methyltransferase MnmC
MNPIVPRKTTEENQDLGPSKSNQNSLELVKTNDGSTTIYHPDIGEHYHSHHGALQESKHVFLGSGLQFFLDKYAQENGRAGDTVSILELGFGTGLNYLLTADYCYKNKITLHYTGIERFPLTAELINKTGYENFVDKEISNNFYTKYSAILAKEALHDAKVLSDSFLTIAVLDALEFQSDKAFDILYFDAFSATHQPEMWTKELLAHLCNFLKPGGVFITYSITGNLKRNLKSIGFQIEKVPGAPGKREMLRAISPL